MPSMRLFRKRKSLAPGQVDATTRDIPDSTRLPYTTAPQAGQQATLAGVPAGAAGPDGVSKGDVHGKTGRATSSDDVIFSPSVATDAEPVPAPVQRVGEKAATQQTGRPSSKKDRFRLFRSRSSHFRKGSDDGGKGGGGGGTKTRLSWPAPRSTTNPTPVSEPQAQAPTHESSRGPPEFEPVKENVSAVAAPAPAADASPRPPIAAASTRDLQREHGQQQQIQQQRQAQRRPNSVVGTSSASVDTSSSPLWRLQGLKRLPSLSLKRRLSRRDKLKPPQVIVTPATVVS